uniref:Odorant receptor n=1 Tax=Cephus cinctus TaxID=211228 RepID=A0A1W6L1A3_CEPCN|nr:odorant receptor 18 [Cephus cinctus]
MNRNNFVRDNVMIYKCLGSWPLDCVARRLENTRYILGLTLIAVITVFNGLQYLDLFIEWGDWGFISENISVSFIYSIFVSKIYVFYSRRREIMEMVLEIDNYVRKTYKDGHQSNVQILQSCEDIARRIKIVFGWSALLTVIILHTWPIASMIFKKDPNLRMLGVPAYFPFSLNSTNNYAIAYVVEIVTASVMSLHTVNFDTFFISCILFAIGRLRILHNSINNIKKIAPSDLQMKFSKNETYQAELQKCIHQLLSEAIAEHQKIILFCQVIDSMLSWIMFIGLFIYSVMLCFVGMRIIMIGPSIKLLQLMEYLAIMMTQIFLYYWHGNELKLESLKIHDAAYNCDWYSFDRNSQQTIMFIMMRGQKPIYLTAGKFYYVTLETFLSGDPTHILL